MRPCRWVSSRVGGCGSCPHPPDPALGWTAQEVVHLSLAWLRPLPRQARAAGTPQLHATRCWHMCHPQPRHEPQTSPGRPSSWDAGARSISLGLLTPQVHTQEGPGDILVFLTGQDEIESMERLLQVGPQQAEDSGKADGLAGSGSPRSGPCHSGARWPWHSPRGHTAPLPHIQVYTFLRSCS